MSCPTGVPHSFKSQADIPGAGAWEIRPFKHILIADD